MSIAPAGQRPVTVSAVLQLSYSLIGALLKTSNSGSSTPLFPTGTHVPSLMEI
jgi:hypothetical protein